MKRLLTGATVLAGLAALLTITINADAGTDKGGKKTLREAVTVDGVMAHARALQKIADANGGNRAAGTPGYAASAAYVRSALEKAGYRVTEQKFTAEQLGGAGSAKVSYAGHDLPAATIVNSPLRKVTGTVVPVKNIIVPTTKKEPTAGCKAADFRKVGRGKTQIALVQAGTCSIDTKAELATKAGYAAVLAFDTGLPLQQGVLFDALLDQPKIPVVGISYADGAALFQQLRKKAVTAEVHAVSVKAKIKSSNVIADTAAGDAGKVLVVGAHLDSVATGPGINDNASGTAIVLEMAKQLAALKPEQAMKVRFAFWGAEEIGLLGSEHYVKSLDKAGLAKIKGNLNFDMLGSPNYARMVLDGDGSVGKAGPTGSAAIEKVFLDYFAAQGLSVEQSAFDGRSDYAPFRNAGIPVGGLLSGAEEEKTEEQAASFGGTVGKALDGCYHQACDTVDNLNRKALDELGDAAAHAVQTMAGKQR